MTYTYLYRDLQNSTLTILQANLSSKILAWYQFQYFQLQFSLQVYQFYSLLLPRLIRRWKMFCAFSWIFLNILQNYFQQMREIFDQLSEEGENASIDSDLISVADEKQQSDLPVQDDSSSRRRRTTKQFKISRIVHRKFYFRCIFGILCIQSYFIANYVKCSKVFNNFEGQAIEFQYLAKGEPFLAFTLNSLRECIATDNDIQIFHQEALQICKTQIEEIYSLYSKLFEKHLQNQDIHTDKYMDSFQDIVRKDACQILDLNSFQISLQECQLFAKGIVSQGMQPALI